MSRFSIYLLFCLLFCSLLNAQQQPGPAQVARGPNAPHACQHLFTVGKSTSNTYLQYCVTDHGNISSIETPFGHLQMGAQGEGYGLCQQDDPTVEYYDYIAGDSGNWNPPQILSVLSSPLRACMKSKIGTG